ncbi:unnamed protein product [Ixodes pacificus]
MSIYNQILENKLKELAKGGSAVAKQELLIQQKKREIEAKLQNAQAAQAKAAGVGLKPAARKPSLPLPTPTIKTEPVDRAESCRVNSFKNDGSFLEQFRKLQSMKASSTVASTPPGPSVPPAPTGNMGGSQPGGLVIKLQAPAPVNAGVSQHCIEAVSILSWNSVHGSHLRRYQTCSKILTLQPSAVAPLLDGEEDEEEDVKGRQAVALAGRLTQAFLASRRPRQKFAQGVDSA